MHAHVISDTVIIHFTSVTLLLLISLEWKPNRYVVMYEYTVYMQVLLDVTAVEFVTFMRILTSLPSMNTLVGRQQLVEIVADQADLSSAFNVCVFHFQL